MSIEQFVKSRQEMQDLADGLYPLTAQSTCNVVRYKQTVFDSTFFELGRMNINRCGLNATFNVEDIEHRIYSAITGEELFPFNLPEFQEWRKREEIPFVFNHKGHDLPNTRVNDYRPLPNNFTQWDEDLRAFTKEYRNVRLTREFGVEQTILANSQGGILIESRPFWALYYRQGYGPHLVSRGLGAYVSSAEDINRLPRLIQYIPDPTPDGRIRHSATFTEAFAHLYEISKTIVFENLTQANLSQQLTHDAIMLCGVPIHEIFGHQFEEPIEPIPVGQQSLFPIGKNIQNPNIVLSDTPNLKLEGLNVLGGYAFDAYGRPSRETVHISDGIVKNHLGAEYVDAKNLPTFLGIEQSEFLGNARQGTDGLFPQARMSCTTLQGLAVENGSWEKKVLMMPSHGYVLEGNFFKLIASECYILGDDGEPKRIGPLEGSRAIYDAVMGMHILPETSYHIGNCSKPCALDDGHDAEITVSTFTNNQLWENLTLRAI
ncbi:hypothetical protein GF373_07005 [bacterium]|nr:hypothetical protein [bacterium]